MKAPLLTVKLLPFLIVVFLSLTFQSAQVQAQQSSPTPPASDSSTQQSTFGTRPSTTTPTPASEASGKNNAELEKQIKDLSRRIEELEKEQKSQPKIEQDEEGVISTKHLPGALSWLASPFLLMPLVLLLLVALLLHALHIIRLAPINRRLSSLESTAGHKDASMQQPLAAAQITDNAALETLSQQLRQQHQDTAQNLARLDQIERRLDEHKTQLNETMQALALVTDWIGQSQMSMSGSDGSQPTEATTSLSDSDREAQAAKLARYQEYLRLYASRVEPLAQMLARLVEKINARGQASTDLANRIQQLYQGIVQFDRLYQGVSQQLAALRSGKSSAHASDLRAEQQKLLEQVRAGQLSIAQHVQMAREMTDRQQMSRDTGSFGAPQSEEEIKAFLTRTPGFLMDWFDDLYRLQSQAQLVARSPIEEEIINELSQITATAREVLGKFDIQPEEIQMGQTAYDRRLHDAALVRQSSQFPVNTIIEVHRCGFRRMSTGEALRRPQVVVAGAIANS